MKLIELLFAKDQENDYDIYVNGDFIPFTYVQSDETLTEYGKEKYKNCLDLEVISIGENSEFYYDISVNTDDEEIEKELINFVKASAGYIGEKEYNRIFQIEEDQE